MIINIYECMGTVNT